MKTFCQLFVFLFSVAIGTAVAESLSLSWEASTTREDGAAITGPIHFEVWSEGERLSAGPDPTFTVEHPSGTTCFEIYQFEGEARSKPLIRCVTVYWSPPLAPTF